jgi:hypothetical protein
MTPLAKSQPDHVRRCREARNDAESLIGPIMDKLRDMDPVEAWYLSTELVDRMTALDRECEQRAYDSEEYAHG